VHGKWVKHKQDLVSLFLDKVQEIRAQFGYVGLQGRCWAAIGWKTIALLGFVGPQTC